MSIIAQSIPTAIGSMVPQANTAAANGSGNPADIAQTVNQAATVVSLSASGSSRTASSGSNRSVDGTFEKEKGKESINKEKSSGTGATTKALNVVA